MLSNLMKIKERLGNENRQYPLVIYELHKFNFVLFVSHVGPLYFSVTFLTSSSKNIYYIYIKYILLFGVYPIKTFL